MTLAADKTKINFVCEIETYNRLFDEGKRTGIPISELIRQGIELRLASTPQRKGAKS